MCVRERERKRERETTVAIGPLGPNPLENPSQWVAISVGRTMGAPQQIKFNASSAFMSALGPYGPGLLWLSVATSSRTNSTSWVVTAIQDSVSPRESGWI